MRIDETIEPHYVFSNRHPERSEVYRRIAELSEQARQRWPVRLDLPYGAHPRERLDLFPGPAGAPLLVFIHGGYWRSLDKASFSHVAPPFLQHGWSVAVVTYPLAPQASLAEIVASVRKAVAWLGREGQRELGGSRCMVLSGHSAGGHLAAMAMNTAPAGAPPLVGCAPLSGLFDLRPIARTSIGEAVRLQESEAAALSPLDKIATAGWLLAGVGGAETPGFIEQTAAYVKHRQLCGDDASMLLLSDLNHYTVLLDLAREDGPLLRGIEARLAGAARPAP